MVRFKELLTGKIGRERRIASTTARKQQLSAAMAWQILNVYPNRRIPRTWENYRNLRGVLLADEVGGGKTFEALAIVTKAFQEKVRSRKSRFRVLIIAAPAIRSKWKWCDGGEKAKCDSRSEACNDCGVPDQYDLSTFLEQARFRRKNTLVRELFRPKTPEEYSTRIIKRKRDWKVLFRDMSRQGVWISSISSLPSTQGRKKEATFKKKYKFPTGSFDWIIADEAHVVRSGYRASDENLPALSGTAVRKLYAVLNANPKAKILFLTATPFQNNVHELTQMISLLESDGKGITGHITQGLKGFQKLVDDFTPDSPQVDGDAIERMCQGLQHDIRCLLSDEEKSIHRPPELQKNGQRDGLDDFMRDVIVRNKKEKINPDLVGVELDEREKLQYLLFRDLVYEKEDETRSMVSVNLSELVSSPDAFIRSLRGRKPKYRQIKALLGENLIFERKYRALVEEIEKTRIKDKKVIVVYCRFIPTLNLLAGKLKAEKWRVECLDGTTPVPKRKPILEKMRRINARATLQKPMIFLVSQVGNEGLDFDAFSQTVIHFDGHYNPAVIDQRNGRIYRGKNTVHNLQVKHVLLKETYDQRIEFIEQKKRRMKDFYLGDSSLDRLFEKAWREDPRKKKELFKKLNFVIDLEPKRKWLLPTLRHEV